MPAAVAIRFPPCFTAVFAYHYIISSQKRGYYLMTDYQSVQLKEEIHIESLLALHYFEYTGDFFFPGEAHNFWEFLYVDKGEVQVTSGSQACVLKKGDIIFYKPMEFHSLCSCGAIAPNLVTASFECDSPAIRFFEDKVLQVSDSERALMARMVQEAYAAYSSPLDDLSLKHMEPRKNPPFASEQFIRLSLEMLLLLLIRKGAPSQAAVKATASVKERTDRDVLNRVILYLEEHVRERLSLDDVCRDNLIGRSYLQKMFRERVGGGVMEYFGKLKIEAAKQAIRERSGSFTEIARDLGYTSIHYFSRHFKKITGMTPSEYASSSKIRAEGLRPSIKLMEHEPPFPFRTK